VTISERIEAGWRERRVLARVCRAAWRLEQAEREGDSVVIAEKQRISLTCGDAAWTADQPSRTARSATAPSA
jgi:hypothetical protein